MFEQACHPMATDGACTSDHQIIGYDRAAIKRHRAHLAAVRAPHPIEDILLEIGLLMCSGLMLRLSSFKPARQ